MWGTVNFDGSGAAGSSLSAAAVMRSASLPEEAAIAGDVDMAPGWLIRQGRLARGSDADLTAMSCDPLTENQGRPQCRADYRDRQLMWLEPPRPKARREYFPNKE
ncbi:MAG TPA: hypothetical protein VFI65_03195 [Streptosporangiaceae bacterium]|nr:hypothetical protein [Streptosporangiaceae bacterium]